MKDNQFKSIIWGVILIVLGVLFLLSNMDIIDFHWRDFIQLWPMLLVYWGLSALPINNYIKLVLVILVLGFTVYLAMEYPQPFRFDFNTHNA
ncbi:MAG: hypothetical protein HOA61_17700 [Bacteroidetes bacterium]|jgi:hypothetical protein|nr:hypothetical protein [Bacteroidota bacterium]MBT6837869.1 hypothetical protein [Bacteroidota bacterium]MBT7828460.1 hypothetical protein [Bacteroidota bacterium]MBT7993555.1 hypothetical protein [Bacteroidota bacterium]